MTAEQLSTVPIDSPDWWLLLASRAETRRGWALCVWGAFETRTALLLGQGLLTTQEAQAGAWAWLGTELERMPAPPPWTPVRDVGVGEP